MAKLAGLAGFVSELRAMRTNLIAELRHVDSALSVLSRLGGGSNHTMSAAGRRSTTCKRRSRAGWNISTRFGFMSRLDAWCWMR